MAKKTNAEYKREQRERKLARQAEIGERDIIVPMSAGVWSQLNDLCALHGFTDWRELVFTLIRNCHAAGPVAGAAMLEIPRAGFVPTAAQLRVISEPCASCGGFGIIIDRNSGETVECPKCAK